MASLEKNISQGTDDCGESNLNKVDLTSKTYKLNSKEFGTGYIFRDITIPKGSTINSANLSIQLISVTASLFNQCINYIYGVDEDTINTWDTSTITPSTRRLTTAKVNWNEATNMPSPNIREHDVREIVQEIVNRSGWQSNNMGFIVKVDRYGRTADMVLGMFENNEIWSESPRIDINYTEPVTNNTIFYSSFLANGTFY